MPKISIILPVYNVEKYIAKSIESIQNQSFKDFELLVVIDGSPDKSKEIALEYAKYDNRIHILEKNNGGLSDARNYGLDRSQGEYIYFIDSDDWIESNLLEENITILEKNKLDFIIFGYFQDDTDTNENLIKRIKKIPKPAIWKKGDTSLKLDESTLGLLGYAWNKIYKREYLEENKLRFIKGISLVEDILFNSLVYTKSDTIYFNDNAYYHYINREVPTLMKTFHANSFDLVKEKGLALKEFLNTWQFTNTKETLAHNNIGGVRYCVHNLFSYKNQLTLIEKFQFVKKIITDKEVEKNILFYQPKNIQDKIYTFLIKYKLTSLIIAIALCKK